MANHDPYASIHYITNLESATVEDLRSFIRTYPVIDNHAHNILKEQNAYGNTECPFECIFSEAQGHALHDHVHSSLAYMRGVNQLAELFSCAPTLTEVKARRNEFVRRDYAGLVRKCFEGTHGLLLDDGLNADNINPVNWHQQFVPTSCRIARIEAIAAELLENLALSAGFLKPGVDANWSMDQSEAFLGRFNTMFRSQIRSLARDPSVRGFKSVVCYRSGLDVTLNSRNLFRPHSSLAETPLLRAFHIFLKKAVSEHNYRVEQKDLNDFLVVATCEELDKLVELEAESLPIQFHTGLGDNDIHLVKSNPAYMQEIVKAFPGVDFVLLHSSYPYTREAAYLATTYSNVWMDIGEIFPMLSREGGEQVLRQALELTPTTKLLWSTDGHFFPETYYLANKQGRAALETVLVDYVSAGELSISQAVTITADFLFWNANILYKLDEERKYPQLLRACGRSQRAGGQASLYSYRGSTFRQSAGVSEMDGLSRATTLASPEAPPRYVAARPQSSFDTLSVQSPVMTRRVTSDNNNTEAFQSFLTLNPDLKYIWLQFIDNTGTLRNRMVTVSQFRKQLDSGKLVGITKALPRLLQNEWPAAGCSATGEFLIKPDLSSLCMNKAISSPSATVQTWWMDWGQWNSLEHFDRCPRWTLQRQANALKNEFNIDILMGFEVEIIFVKPVLSSDGSDYEDFEVLSNVHSWSNMTYQQLEHLPMIEEIVETLAEIGIEVPQFHAEAAPGQWEFPLPAFEPVKAVDVLYKARDTIRNVAKKHGLKATLYPRPYAMAPGSASHAHFSINGPGDTVERYEESFSAGILQHLPSILAFSLPIEESYARIAAGVWAGGEYVTWGTQNREVPLRKCGPGHWEMKTVDGIGNMYLSMAAVLASGLHGLRENTPLRQRDTTMDASTLSEQQRAELGITTKLPNTLEKSLDALSDDTILITLLGENVVNDYIAIKEAEMKLLGGFEEDKRRVWLMARY